MSAFVWEDKYSLQIAELDRQHQKLFALFNELYDAMQDGHADEVIGKILERVLDYCVYHFAYEEKLFTVHGYPGAAMHRAEHAHLTAQTKALAERLQEGQGVVPAATLKFLYDWLARHILGADKAYVPYLQKQGVL